MGAIMGTKETARHPNPVYPESAHALALQFHTTYERLAPDYGYETRTETREFDRTSPNGRLMIAVCDDLIYRGYVVPNLPHLSGRGERMFPADLTAAPVGTVASGDTWQDRLVAERNELFERVQKLDQFIAAGCPGADNPDLIERQLAPMITYLEILDDQMIEAGLLPKKRIDGDVEITGDEFGEIRETGEADQYRDGPPKFKG